MATGIRAEIRVDRPTDCPIATVSGATGTASYAVSRSVDPTSPTAVTEEFAVDDGTDPTAVDGAEAGTDGVEEVFSYGGRRVFRFTRAGGRGCPCECIEEFDCPVTDVYARNGSLYLTFHAEDVDQLRDIVGRLREAYDVVDVRRLLQSRSDSAVESLVLFDQNELTDRQREVLETAHAMGYFEHPRDSNAGEVAAALDITTATFTEHMAAAQRKILAALVAA